MSNKMRDEIIQVLLATSGESEGMTAEAIIAALTHHQAESEPAAHVFPDDLKKLQTSECSVTAYSVEMGHPDKGETLALFLGPQPTAQVPEGWKVHEPTPGVIKIEKEGAGHMHVRRGIDYNPFKAMAVLQALAEDMLAAAPSIAEGWDD